MTNDNDFFQELGRVPDLPPNLYHTIQRKIRRRSQVSRSLLALAAALVLALGATTFWGTSKGFDTTVSAEVADELQTVHDYCNGQSINQELQTYAYYDGDISN
jgi:hypothetical protein